MSAIWGEDPPVSNDAEGPRVTHKHYRPRGWFVSLRLTLDAPQGILHLARAVSAYPFESGVVARQAGSEFAALCEAYCTGVDYEYNHPNTP